MTKEELLIEAEIFKASCGERKDVLLHLDAIARIILNIIRYLINKTG